MTRQSIRSHAIATMVVLCLSGAVVSVIAGWTSTLWPAYDWPRSGQDRQVELYYAANERFTNFLAWRSDLIRPGVSDWETNYTYSVNVPLPYRYSRDNIISTKQDMAEFARFCVDLSTESNGTDQIRFNSMDGTNGLLAQMGLPADLLTFTPYRGLSGHGPFTDDTNAPNPTHGYDVSQTNYLQPPRTAFYTTDYGEQQMHDLYSNLVAQMIGPDPGPAGYCEWSKYVPFPVAWTGQTPYIVSYYWEGDDTNYARAAAIAATNLTITTNSPFAQTYRRVIHYTPGSQDRYTLIARTFIVYDLEAPFYQPGVDSTVKYWPTTTEHKTRWYALSGNGPGDNDIGSSYTNHGYALIQNRYGLINEDSTWTTTNKTIWTWGITNFPGGSWPTNSSAGDWDVVSGFSLSEAGPKVVVEWNYEYR